MLHSVSRSNDECDRSFKRQRTNDSVDTLQQRRYVTNLQIDPLDRPSGSMSDCNIPIKAGWYTGPISSSGRHGTGSTKHDDGTHYSGEYVNDRMEGWGEYTFTLMRQMVTSNQGVFHRVTEKVFKGQFVQDLPLGKGFMITTTTDSQNNQEQFVKVTYDVGFYREERTVGEGVRFTYTKTHNGWKEVCTRTDGGVCSGLVVGRSYGIWLCDCLGLDSYPVPPSL